MQPATRYTLTAQALHWLTALLILAILPVAWVMVGLHVLATAWHLAIRWDRSNAGRLPRLSESTNPG